MTHGKKGETRPRRRMHEKGVYLPRMFLRWARAYGHDSRRDIERQCGRSTTTQTEVGVAAGDVGSFLGHPGRAEPASFHVGGRSLPGRRLVGLIESDEMTSDRAQFGVAQPSPAVRLLNVVHLRHAVKYFSRDAMRGRRTSSSQVPAAAQRMNIALTI